MLGITCVAGNLYVDQCVRNALISIDYAGTYAPPVYRGMEKPMIREKMVTALSLIHICRCAAPRPAPRG